MLLGIVLVAWGVNGTETLSFDLEKLVAVWPPDKPALLIALGIVVALVGLYLSLPRFRRIK